MGAAPLLRVGVDADTFRAPAGARVPLGAKQRSRALPLRLVVVPVRFVLRCGGHLVRSVLSPFLLAKNSRTVRPRVLGCKTRSGTGYFSGTFG